MLYFKIAEANFLEIYNHRIGMAKLPITLLDDTIMHKLCMPFPFPVPLPGTCHNVSLLISRWRHKKLFDQQMAAWQNILNILHDNTLSNQLYSISVDLLNLIKTFYLGSLTNIQFHNFQKIKKFHHVHLRLHAHAHTAGSNNIH